MGGAQRRQSSLPSKGKVSFNFPPKRVMICGQDSALSKAVIKAFAESGCRVALYTPDTDCDPGGARLIISTGDSSIDLSNVLKSWGDVDIIISAQSTGTSTQSVISTILNHRLSLPYPNDYGLRLINIGSNCPTGIPAGVTLNSIILETDDNPVLLRQGALTALFLSVPELAAIHNSSIKIN